MPATYRHIRRSVDISPRTSIFSKPEPPTPIKRHIGNLEVDESTFRKYDRSDYKLGETDFCFHDLRGVMLYAESSTLAEEYPEMAEAAKKIIAGITAEITGKGEENTMNTPKNAMDYLNALHDTYAESRAAYDAATQKLESVRKYYETCEQDVRRDGSANNVAHLDIARGKYQLAQEEYHTAYKSMKADYDRKCKELRSQLNEHLGEHYAASPDKLDSATMQLLNTGICTPAELSRLTERHKDNPTMLRILGSHADQMLEGKNKYSIDAINALYAVKSTVKAVSDGSRELNVYDQANAVLRQALREDQKSAEWFDSHIEKDFCAFQTAMDELSGGSVETAE